MPFCQKYKDLFNQDFGLNGSLEIFPLAVQDFSVDINLLKDTSFIQSKSH